MGSPALTQSSSSSSETTTEASNRTRNRNCDALLLIAMVDLTVNYNDCHMKAIVIFICAMYSIQGAVEHSVFISRF